jgi:hypothetical protein
MVEARPARSLDPNGVDRNLRERLDGLHREMRSNAGEKIFCSAADCVHCVLSLIADLDNPRREVIWINPQNLMNLSKSM